MQEKRNVSKLLIGLVLVLVGAGLLVWALMGKSAEAPSAAENTSQTKTTQEVATPDANTDEPAEASLITFTSTGFTPSELTVKKGAIVTVKNESNSSVQFSSDDHPTHTKETEMNLKVLKPGESASFTITRVGSWGFHDHIDDSKTGTLTVTE